MTAEGKESLIETSLQHIELISKQKIILHFCTDKRKEFDILISFEVYQV